MVTPLSRDKLGTSLSYQILFELSFDDLCRFEQQSHPLSNEFWRQKLNYDFPQGVSMLYDTKKLYIFQQSEKNWNFRRKYIFFYIEACVTEGSFGYLPLTTAFERIVWSGQYQLLVPFLRFELKQRLYAVKEQQSKTKSWEKLSRYQRRKQVLKDRECESMLGAIVMCEQYINNITDPCTLENIWAFFVKYGHEFDSMSPILLNEFIVSCLKYKGDFPTTNWTQMTTIDDIFPSWFLKYGTPECIQRWLNLHDFDTLDDLLMNAYFKYDIVECCAALIQHEKLDQLKSLLTTVCLNPDDIRELLMVAYCMGGVYRQQFLKLLATNMDLEPDDNLEDKLITMFIENALELFTFPLNEYLSPEIPHHSLVALINIEIFSPEIFIKYAISWNLQSVLGIFMDRDNDVLTAICSPKIDGNLDMFSSLFTGYKNKYCAGSINYTFDPLKIGPSWINNFIEYYRYH